MASPSPPTPSFDSGANPNTNPAPLYYAIAAVSIASILLLLYKTVMAVWCSEDCFVPWHGRSFLLPSHGNAPPNSWVPRLIPAIKYRKGEEENDSGRECSVCLSIFEAGEEIRQLPKCKHSFHAPCIDMWLYSHSSCPLCRANLGMSPSHNRTVARVMEQSRQEHRPERSRVPVLAFALL